MVFIESNLFTSLVSEYLTDDEFCELQIYLSFHPEIGKIISGSGGIRKIRWARQGIGKSGGVRVIYYWVKPHDQIYFLTIYGKNERENIDAITMKRIVKQLEEFK